MATASSGLGRWTRYFTVASATSLVVLETAAIVGVDQTTLALFSILGFVCPMIFGMAYLLLPSYVGRTLVNPRMPGLHFGVAYVGVGSILVDRVGSVPEFVGAAGVVVWSIGVALFVGTLARTIVPAVVENPAIVVRTPDRPQRSTQLATAMIPVAVGYLVVGTVGLLMWKDLVQLWSPPTLSQLLHFYGAGLGALLIFALGLRLMTGFFHVTPPTLLAWSILLPGSVGPLFVGTFLWGDVPFKLGAVLMATAMVAYTVAVFFVFYRADRRRVGLYGILLGAIAGFAGVGIALLVVLEGVRTSSIVVHAYVIYNGFFPLTIVGYAYLFFPVTAGSFRGATRRTALVSITLLGLGVSISSVGLLIQLSVLEPIGAVLSLTGGLCYLYLIWGRLLER